MRGNEFNDENLQTGIHEAHEDLLNLEQAMLAERVGQRPQLYVWR